jgi:hypothetical protein
MTDTAAAAPVRPGYRYYVLAVLILVYMLNFLDRQIIGILGPRLIEEFGLTDGEFGLLGGIAFASVYSTLALPLAWLADRYSRVWIMTGALTVWSGFTALCGVAGSYGQLFLFRMGVGVFPDRRLFPAQPEGPRPGRLRLRYSAGHGGRHPGRRPSGGAVRLAHGLYRRRPGRPAAGPAPAHDRARSRARRH